MENNDEGGEYILNKRSTVYILIATVLFVHALMLIASQNGITGFTPIFIVGEVIVGVFLIIRALSKARMQEAPTDGHGVKRGE